MKTIDKTVNLSRAKKIFKNYATKLVEALESRGVNMIKEGDNVLRWKSFRENQEKEDCAEVQIDLYDNIALGSLSFFILIAYPNSNNLPKKTVLEKKIRKNTEEKIYKKYSLTNLYIHRTITGTEAPILEPVEKVANQLCLALKCYDKISSLKTILRIKKIEKGICKLIEKEADIITESFFQ